MGRCITGVHYNFRSLRLLSYHRHSPVTCNVYVQFPLRSSKHTLEIKGFIPPAATINLQNASRLWPWLTIETSTTLVQPTVTSCLDYCRSPDGFPAPLSLWLHSLFLPPIDYSRHSMCADAHADQPCSALPLYYRLLLSRDGVFFQYLSVAHAQGLAHSWQPVNACWECDGLNESINKEREKESFVVVFSTIGGEKQ